MNSSEVCIIIPCYNEEKRIDIKAFQDFLLKHNNISFCFVNDGSTDDTLKILQKFSDDHKNAQVYNLEKNSGKAEAVRRGICHILNLQFNYIGFWDADLATPLSEIHNFLDLTKTKPQYQYITGARINRQGANIIRKWYRHYLGRIFATIASLALKMAIYDTQCGAKIFTKDMATQLFTEKFSSKWLFDIEILFRLKKTPQYLKKNDIIYEYPLNRWHDIHGSKLGLFDFVKAPLELLKMYLKYSKNSER